MAEQLIPGLPDDIALDCLARVPLRHHAGLRPVCRRWRGLVTAEEFAGNRVRIGAAEEVVFLVQALPDPAGGDPEKGEGEGKEEIGKRAAPAPAYGVSAYNATAGEWRRCGGGVPMFAQCAAAGGRVVVVGGWDPATYAPVRGVSVLDPRTGGWLAGAEMPEPARSLFACAAAGGRVYVAGGHDDGKNALRGADAYDPAANEWAAVAEMREERDECRGVAVGGRFVAVSGYGTESQGRFGASAECYDPALGEWVREEGVWGEEEQRGGGGAASCFAVDGVLFHIDCSEGDRRGVRAMRDGEWRTVAPVPAGMRPGGCAALIGGGKVFVMASDATGGHCGWILDVNAKSWAQIGTPASFSGFVYSAAVLRL